MTKVVIFFFVLKTLAAQNNLFDKAGREYSSGNFDTVIRLLEGQIPPSKEYFAQWYQLGISYQKLNKYDSAKDALYQAYQYEKFDVPLLMSLGRNYRNLGAPSYSLLFFEQAREVQPDNFNIMVELGASYCEVREYEKALAVYSYLTERDSTNSHYHKKLGECYNKLGKNDRALDALNKAFKLNPRDAGVALLLGSLYVNSNEYKSALSVIREGLNHNGHSDKLLKLSAEALFKMKRYDEAEIEFRAIINHGDSTAAYFQKLGFCNYFIENAENSEQETGAEMKYEQAIWAFTKAIEKDTTDDLSHIYLGICYKEKREYEKAVKFINKGVELAYPSYLADAYLQLGSGYEMNGDYPESIKAYKTALKLQKDDKEILFQLAALYDRYYKDKEVPMIYYQKFLRESENTDIKLRNYAEGRIEYLRERIHFNN